MRLYVLMFLSLLLSILMTSEVSASSQVDWTNADPEVIFKEDLVANPSSWCQGYKRKISVERDYVNACIYDGTNLSFAYYSVGGVKKQAVRVGYDPSFYLISGVCDNASHCFYSSVTDQLVANRAVSGKTTMIFTVYDDFSKNITKHVDLIKQHIRYSFDTPGAIYPLGHPDMPESFNAIRAMGISKNGRWVVAELYENGIVLIDLESMNIRRVYHETYPYGRGYDPTYEITVSDNGEIVAVVGQNVPSMIIQTDSACGEQVMQGSKLNKITKINCKNTAINIGVIGLAYPFWYASSPVLNSEGSRLDIFIFTRGSQRVRVSMSAPGNQQVFSDMEYIALGDSFTSGEGETSDYYYIDGTNVKDERCHVSKRSYPYVLANYLGMGINVAKNIACSGATIVDILGAADYAGQGNRLSGKNNINSLKAGALLDFLPGRVPQIDFVKYYRPQMITVGIGGNDAGFMEKLKACVMPGTCDWATDNARVSVFKELTNFKTVLTNLYSRLQNTSPQSKILAIGYPRIINVDSCDSNLGLLLDKTERRFIAESIRLLNSVIKDAATEAGIDFVDNDSAFESAKLCQSTDNPAMNGIRFGDDMSVLGMTIIGAESFHPTPYGHQLIAKSIKKSVDDSNVCVNCISTYGSEYWNVPEDAPISIYKSMVKNDATLADKKLDIFIPATSFAPNTIVKIELHSDTIDLGAFYADDNGGMQLELTLPESVDVGYHTLHVYGTSSTDELVDYYQTVNVLPNDSSTYIDGAVTTIQTGGHPDINSEDNIKLEYALIGYQDNSAVLAGLDWLDTAESNIDLVDDQRPATESYFAVVVSCVAALIILIIVCWRVYVKSRI